MSGSPSNSTIDTPKAGPLPPSLQLATGMATSRVQAPTPPVLRHENIKQGESWSASFERAKAAVPSEIIPGLYLGNMKTAAAYILGKVDENYPPVSCIVTILTDSNAYAPLPQAQGSGKRIARKVIEKLDTTETKLIEDFDEAGEFIHAGVQAYLKDREDESFSSITKGLHSLQVRGRTSASATGISTPLSPVASLNTPMRSKTTTFVSSTPAATGTTSRSSCNSTIAAPYDTTFHPRPTYCAPSKHTKGPGAVLVHCHAGVSRSATIVAAYLLKYHPHLFPSTSGSNASPSPSFAKSQLHTTPTTLAIAFIQSKRAVVNPSIGFRLQLKLYYGTLGCSVKDETDRYKDAYLHWWEEREQEELSVTRTNKRVKSSVFAYNDEGLAEFPDGKVGW